MDTLGMGTRAWIQHFLAEADSTYGLPHLRLPSCGPTFMEEEEWKGEGCL